MKVIHYEGVSERKVEDEEAEGAFIRVLIGPDDGARNFFMRRFRIVPGGHTPYHAHDREHEIFVLKGPAELMTAKGPRPLNSGDVVFLQSGEKHQFRNNGDTDIAFLCLVPASE